MRVKHHIKILLAFTLLISCTQSEDYIIETDLNQFLPDTINGETIKESNERSRLFTEKLISKTVNRAIPGIVIFSLNGEKLNLRDVLNNETIIISSDIYCGWGTECLTNDFPNAIKQLANVHGAFDVICLLKREASDIQNPVRFDSFLTELEVYYEKIYIIDENEARKINLLANPTRLYISKNKVVKQIGFGVSLIEDGLLKEIKENTGAKI